MITLAVTAYNESNRGHFGWIRECIDAAINHHFVRDIVIVDDASDDYSQLSESLQGILKVYLYHNVNNLGVFGNKLESVAMSKTDWVLMCDSDNIMDGKYIDAIEAMQPWDDAKWYSASFARPNFDYRHLTGAWSVANVCELLKLPLAECFLNTGNQFVHRGSFMGLFERFQGKRFDWLQPDYLDIGDRSDLYWRRVYDAADSIFYNKTWMLNGGVVEVREELQYDHRYKEDSSWGNAPSEKTRLPAFYLKELIHAR